MPPAQEIIGPALPSIRRRHPSHAGLSAAVQEDEGCASLFLGDLVQHIGMIDMGGLSCPAAFPLILGPERAGRGKDGAAGRENALLRDDEGCGEDGGSRHKAAEQSCQQLFPEGIFFHGFHSPLFNLIIPAAAGEIGIFSDGPKNP